MHGSRRVMGVALGAGLVLTTAAGVNGGTPVDPNTLTPPPPPGATCQANGPTTVICHTAITFVFEGEPLFDIACGTIYQNGTDSRYGIRWYENGLISRRVFRGQMDGTWSLTPDASGETLSFTGNWSASATWAVPGDDDTFVQTEHGLEFHATSPGLGGSLLLAGQIEHDNVDVHGANRIDEPLGQISPASIAILESIFCD